MALLKLTTAGSWTLATGVENNTGENIRLVNSFSDSYSNSSFDSTYWDLVTAASGTAVETSTLALTAPAVADAAFAVTGSALNTAEAFTYEVRFKLDTLVDHNTFFLLFDKATQPAAQAFNGGVGIQQWVYVTSAGALKISRASNPGVFTFWDDTNKVWAGSDTTAATLTTGTEYTFKLINDGTRFYTELYTGASLTLSTAGTHWGSFFYDSDDTWLIVGDNYTDQHKLDMQVTYSKIRIPYLTTSPTATMGQIAVATNIDELPITEDNGANGSITWDYDIGAGWVTGKTLAQLNTALVNTSPATLNLRAVLISDGSETGLASFNLDNLVIGSTTTGQDVIFGM
jgi:hypothetical protein